MSNEDRVRGFLLAMDQFMMDRPNSEGPEAAPLKHTFCNGIYLREIHLPRNYFIIGKIHKQEHPSFISKGACVVMTEEGVETLEAPKTFISPCGVKRFLFTLTETIWTTVHRTDATTVEEAEQELFTMDYKQIGFSHEEFKLGDKLCQLG